MSEASYQDLMRELRETAPPAPERLRELVCALPTAPQRAFRLRPAFAAAVALIVAVALGAAALGGLRGSSPTTQTVVADFGGTQAPPTGSDQGGAGSLRARVPKQVWSTQLGAAKDFSPIAPGSRLQQQTITMQLRVKDLSGATESAVRRTRSLGGYVAGADYSTDPVAGDSRLDLRIPIQNVQKAIAGFTGLGTILSQHIAVADLQAGLDRLDTRIAASEKLVKSLRGEEQKRAALVLVRLEHQRAGLIRQGAYANLSLQLTSRKPAEKHVAPTRFDRFWDDAGNILGQEAVGVLYFLVVAGPFLLLGAFAILAERERRRRSGNRLLEEAG